MYVAAPRGSPTANSRKSFIMINDPRDRKPTSGSLREFPPHSKIWCTRIRDYWESCYALQRDWKWPLRIRCCPAAWVIHEAFPEGLPPSLTASSPMECEQHVAIFSLGSPQDSQPALPKKVLSMNLMVASPRLIRRCPGSKLKTLNAKWETSPIT